MTKRRLSSVLVFVLFSAIGLYAQNGISNARSVAMGGAYTALARGIEAPSWNPANLALAGKKKPRLNLFSFGAGFHNNSFTFKQYDLYNGAYLTEQDKQDILTSIPAEGFRFNFDTEVQAIGISIGAFALSASGFGSSDLLLSKDIADLLLKGNEIDRIYGIGDSNGEGWGVSSFALSAAFPIFMPLFTQFTVGGSVKYVRGFAYGNVVEAQSSLLTNIEGILGSGRIVIDRALGGSGYALDLGAAAQLDEKITLSASVSNFLNRINWNNETKRFTYSFTADSVSIERVGASDIDSVLIDSEETVDIEPFSSTLPAELRIGMARTTRRLTLAIDYKQGLKRAAGVSTTPEIAVGAELRFWGFLPLRTGVSLGGKEGISTAAGFALDFSIFSLDFAVASRGGIFSGRGAAFAFGWMFRL